MSEPQQSQSQALAESLRAAVVKTLEATARPAGPARGRAGELVDEVVQRGRGAGEGVVQRGRDASEELARRRQDAGAQIERRRREVGGTIDALARRGQDAGEQLVRHGQGAGEAIARRIGELIERARAEHEGESARGSQSNSQVEG